MRCNAMRCDKHKYINVINKERHKGKGQKGKGQKEGGEGEGEGEGAREEVNEALHWLF